MHSPAERLRSVRIATGYKTAQDAARAMGMKIPTYHGHENGTTGLRRTAAIRYAKFYNISLDWLLMGVGDGRQKLRAATVDSAETEAMLGAADTPGPRRIPRSTASQPIGPIPSKSCFMRVALFITSGFSWPPTRSARRWPAPPNGRCI